MAGAIVKGLADAIAGKATLEVSAEVVAGASIAELASAITGEFTFGEADALATLAA